MFEPQIIGVNNRDLTRFVTDLQFSCDLIPQIPDDIVTISESGIHSLKMLHVSKMQAPKLFLLGKR